MGAAVAYAGNPGPYTQEAGFLGYTEVRCIYPKLFNIFWNKFNFNTYQICENLKSGWSRVWDDEQKTPYAYRGNQWVGYDDVESVAIKVNFTFFILFLRFSIVVYFFFQG